MDPQSFLGSFLSKGLRTNQLEVNTDEKTLRQIARLKEPRELFALPKDKDHDCPQQAPRWPIECQVIEERVVHIPYVPPHPEPLNQTTGSELKPRPVGEENGIVVFNYNPISAVNYDTGKKSKKRGGDSSDSDASSSESRGSTPERIKAPMATTFSKLFDALHSRSTSNSTDDYDEDTGASGSLDATPTNGVRSGLGSRADKQQSPLQGDDEEIEDIWANKSPEYMAATPTYIKSQFGKDVPQRVKVQVRKNGVSPVRISSECMSRIKLSRSKQPLQKQNATAPSASTITLTSTHHNHRGTNSTIITTTTSTTTSTTTATAKKSRQPKSSSIAINPKERLRGGGIAMKKPNGTGKSPSDDDDSTNGIDDDNDEDDDDDDEDDDDEEYSDDRFPDGTRAPAARRRAALDDDDDDEDDEYVEKTTNYDENLPQFSRSAVGGSKLLTNCHPFQHDDTYDGLEFESRFESGNLAKAVMITHTYYELYLRPDLYTSRSKQWFYFRVRKTKKNVIYRFSIVNLVKSDSLYNEGMRPLMYSTTNAKNIGEGWRRCGQNVAYYRNEEETSNADDDEEYSSFTLTFNVEFPHDDDTVYFAHSYPYTYTELQDYLMNIQKHPVKSKYCKLRLLCRSLAGNNVYYLTVTAPTNDEEAMKRKKAIVVSGRVHPSETPSSWMMKGLMDFITGETLVAKRLRHKFIFKLIPMLNPDGVIVGNTRNSLTGKDLNRQYRTVIRETYPSIWYTKAMIKRLIDECGVAMYCDMHAHSRKHNIFIYGCENKRVPEKKLSEQVFPLMMHKNVADKFSFESCKFKIQRSKEGTGRIVVWMLGITNSYTLEASFGGSTLASRKGTHYTTADYEHIGRAFCETLLDYCDENPNKVKRNQKLLKQIKKLRKREKREKKALRIKKLAEQERLRLKIIERLLKEGSSAEEPLNIPLSDYSSDEGETTSSSENEGKKSLKFSDLEGPCCAPTKAPPSSPEVVAEFRRFKFNRMRKIMFELDRLYFQPLLHKRFRASLRKRLQKKRPRKTASSRLKGGDDQPSEATSAASSADVPTSLLSGTLDHRNVASLAERLMSTHAAALGMKVLAVTPSSGAIPKLELLQMRSSCNTLLGGEVGGDTTPVAKKSKRKIHRKVVKSDKAKSPKDTDEMGTDGDQAAAAAAANGEEKHRKKRVNRTLRLFLASRKIIIYRRKKPRKSRVRSKSSQARRKGDQRTPIDLPTTDPGSDLHFSTDDEMPPNEYGGYPSSYSTVPRTRRNLLQSELQRRYLEEIGDGITGRKFMPPELIITSPNKSTETYRKPQSFNFKMQPPPQTAPQQVKETLLEFPMISNPPPRRTNSWHNLNQHNKCVSKTKLPHPYQLLENTNQEDLTVKLSLKKKIWTGVQPDSGYQGPGVDRSRPLSWLIPPQLMPAEHIPPTISRSSASFMKRERSAFMARRSGDPLVDPEALFNACSQKLMAWRNEQDLPSSPRGRMSLNIVVPDPNKEYPNMMRSPSKLLSGGGGGGGGYTNKKKVDKMASTSKLGLDSNNYTTTSDPTAKFKRKK